MYRLLLLFFLLTACGFDSPFEGQNLLQNRLWFWVLHSGTIEVCSPEQEEGARQMRTYVLLDGVRAGSSADGCWPVWAAKSPPRTASYLIRHGIVGQVWTEEGDKLAGARWEFSSNVFERGSFLVTSPNWGELSSVTSGVELIARSE